jgi:HEAT repeat protein
MKTLAAAVLVSCLVAGTCWAARPAAVEDLRGKPLAYLLTKLKDPDVGVRIRAAASICGTATKDGRAVGPLAEALKDPSPMLRELAAVALGEVGDAQAVPPLVAAAKDSEPKVRAGVARGLKYQRGEAVAAALNQLLKDPDWWVRACAAESLVSAAGPLAVEGLLPLLADPNADVRLAAARALGEIGDRRAFDSLMAAAKDRDAEVARAAINSLGLLRTGGETADDRKVWERLNAAVKAPVGPREFKEVLDLIRSGAGVNVQVDWTALEAAGITPTATVTMKAIETTYVGILVRALGQAADVGKAGFVVKDGVLHVSTPAELEKRIKSPSTEKRPT